MTSASVFCSVEWAGRARADEARFFDCEAMTSFAQELIAFSGAGDIP